MNNDKDGVRGRSWLEKIEAAAISISALIIVLAVAICFVVVLTTICGAILNFAIEAARRGSVGLLAVIVLLAFVALTEFCGMVRRWLGL